MNTMPTSLHADEPSFVELFTPKLVTILREGYDLKDLRADALAGLTVAIVALPLSMAIAIASGATPAQGLYTAIVGGFLVSALGGSRFQVGGPAGAFIVLVAATIARHGMEGFFLATVLAGFMLLAIGFLRLGSYIKFIPYPVTVGFTAGIAVIIFASQITDLLGLHLAGKEPGDLIPKLEALAGVMSTFNPSAVALAAGTIVLIATTQRFRPHWPTMLLAVILTGAATWLFHLPVETIGTRFGGIPEGFPAPALPAITWAKVYAVLPDAMSFALLGSIESLLSAVVADGMTGRRHRSNCELVAQGFANIGSALFGGMCVTGTIARTATNVRAGARGPLAGMFHSLFLLVFVLVAAPLARFIPLSALGGVLAIVAWKMADRYAFATLFRSSWGDAVVLSATFLLTIFRDLTTGILVGFGLGTLLFLHRMSQATRIDSDPTFAAGDKADAVGDERKPYDATLATDPDIVVYRISGAFFFGSAAAIGTILDRLAERPKTIVLDVSAVPFLDSTAANTVEAVAAKAARNGVALVVTGANSSVRRTLWTHGVRPPNVDYEISIDAAMKAFPHGASSKS
jgi:SulP family sulfate permease